MNIIMVARYRMRYWWRFAWRFVGVCPDCWTTVNYTTRGRPICPDCGK